MKFKTINDCLQEYYILKEYTGTLCISASNTEGESEARQDGMAITYQKKYIPVEKRNKEEAVQYIYAKDTVSANMPQVYNYVNTCVDIDKVLERRTKFEQKVIYLYIVYGMQEALDYMIEIYGCKHSCKSMNDLDCRLDEILYCVEIDLREIGYIK